MTTLIIDGHNFLHRARAGFDKGDYSLVFTFFRNLRSLVETFSKTHNINRILFVLEGHPKHRYESLPSYKANRCVVEGSEQHKQMVDFYRQKKLIVSLLSDHFPISIMKHVDFECDDIVYNIIKNASSTSQFVVVSNDSDFIQLLNEFQNVAIWNPMKKDWVEGTDYDYVAWKSIVGDSSDNIPGICKGIGDKSAVKLLQNIDSFKEFLLSKNGLAEDFNRNYSLIKFATLNDEQLMNVTCTNPTCDWNAVKNKFIEWNFSSIVADKAWNKFIDTFDIFWKNI